MNGHRFMNSVTPMKRKTNAAPSGYKLVARQSDAELYLYGVIGQDWFGDGITAKRVADDLKALGTKVKTIDVRINSEGGDVFDGKAIYTLLNDHAAKIVVHIDGLAASAASFIAMAGDEIEISEGAFVMIHNAWTIAMGGAEDFRRTADLLETVNGTIRDVYVARTEQPADKVKTWMDSETWFTGKEAVANGFADRMVDNLKVAALALPLTLEPLENAARKFKNLPAALRPNRARALKALGAK